MTKADQLSGVKCFSIAGRMVDMRQRCLGMTDEERRWRAQWLKDQILSPDEPKYVPEYYRQTNNFFRRLWKTPMNILESLLEPTLGATGAKFTRSLIKTGVVGIAVIYAGAYLFKYHSNDFTRRTPEIYISRGRLFPGDPDYPNYFVAKTPYDYFDLGFHSSVLCQDVVIEDVPPPPPPRPTTNLGEPIVCPEPGNEN